MRWELTLVSNFVMAILQIRLWSYIYIELSIILNWLFRDREMDTKLSGKNIPHCVNDYLIMKHLRNGTVWNLLWVVSELLSVILGTDSSMMVTDVEATKVYVGDNYEMLVIVFFIEKVVNKMILSPTSQNVINDLVINITLSSMVTLCCYHDHCSHIKL